MPLWIGQRIIVDVAIDAVRCVCFRGGARRRRHHSETSREQAAGRVTHPNAWSQAPDWATCHMVGNVTMEAESPTEVRVRSRFIMTELRRDSLRTFAGSYRHWLVPEGSTFRIKLQRVDLVNGQAPYDYVLQAWV
jgi:3-phenylpropionate/cinnamic acid dioxygenase small subunit